MNKEKLNLVVIGCSGMGKRHIKAVYENMRANLYGICDIDQSRVESAAALYHPEHTTNDWHDFVNDPNVDAAIIVMPDQLHLEMTETFLRAGKHVLCEKPMALTVAECEKMIQAEKETGLKLMVGQVSRYAPSFAKAKEIIDSGRIGELYFVESEYAHDYSVARGANDWRVSPERHAVIGGGCHAIDLLRWIAGDPTEVYALSNHKCLTDWPVDDCSIAVMKFPNDVNGKVLTSIGCKREYTMRSCFYGTKGTIICDNRSNYLTLFECGDEPLGQHGNRYNIPQMIPVNIAGHNVVAEIKAFVNSVLDETPLPISSMEGASTVAVCNAVVESCACGMPVKVKYPVIK